MRHPSIWAATGVAARSAALAVLALAPSGCHRSPETASPSHGVVQPEPWPEVPEEGFVVIPWGSQVYLEPRFGGASARLGWPGGAPPPWPAPGYVARVLGQRDGFVEIAPVLEVTAQHCGTVLEGESFDVRLYVSPWVLAPVLTREVEVHDEDGSALSLRPGAMARAIPDDPQGRWAVWAAGIRVRAVLPDDAVGLAYAASQPISPSVGGPWQLPEGRPFSFHGTPLEIDPAFGYQVTIASVVPLSEGFRVELVNQCARVLAESTVSPPSWQEPPMFEFGLGGPDAVPPAVLERVVEPAFEDGSLDMTSPVRIDEFQIPSEDVGLLGSFDAVGRLGAGPMLPERVFEEGAPLYLSTAGPVAGTLSQMRVFNEDGWAVGDRMCFHTSFGSRFDPSLAVCLPAAEGRLRNPVVDVHDFGSGVVHPGSIEITGGLTEPTVASALRRHRSDLRRCWGEALLHGAQATTGLELELELDVNGDGGVTHVRVRSPFVAALTDCAVAAAPRWTFSPTADGKPAKVVFSVGLALR